MIRLYLVRNGADEDRDGTRRLTRRARRRFRRVAGAFAHLEEPVQLICAGGKPHVLETARVLARMLGRSDVVEVEELSSRAGADALLMAVSVHGGGRTASRSSATAGSSTILRALGIEEGEIRLRKGSIVRVDVDALPRPRRCIARFRVRASATEPADAFLGTRRAS